MGLGKWNGKRHEPITKWEGSWADEQAQRRGARAFAQGIPYEQNPYTSANERLSWSKGHNGARAAYLEKNR